MLIPGVGTKAVVEVQAGSGAIIKHIACDQRLRGHRLKPRARLLLPDPDLLHNITDHSRPYRLVTVPSVRTWSTKNQQFSRERRICIFD